jgi:hypothetical protein
MFIPITDSNGLHLPLNSPRVEGRHVELKLRLDEKRCWQSPQEEGCTHPLCRNKRALELCSDVTQFSNAYGGNLLLGIGDTKSIVGLPDADEVCKRIEQIITNFCKPLPDFTIHKIVQEKKTVVSIVVRPSVHPIWVMEEPSSKPCMMKLVRRVDESKQTLSMEDAMVAITNSIRGNEIRIRQIAAELRSAERLGRCEVDLAGGVIQRFRANSNDRSQNGGGTPNPPKWSTLKVESILLTLPKHTEHEFVLQFKGLRDFPDGIEVNLPFSAIDHVWRTAKDKLGIVLRVALVLVEHRISVVPIAYL